MTASGPARLFGMYPRKGTISVGSDADLVFYDPNLEWTVRGEDFYGPAKWTPFEGIKCRGKVVQTLLRGKTVFVDGDTPVDGGYGVFLSRNRRIPP
jgi:allantoinase